MFKNEEVSSSCSTTPKNKKPRWLRCVAMYVVMVVVSTIAIHFLEHASLANAFRTALVAAIGKTIAANWVSGIFD